MPQTLKQRAVKHPSPGAGGAAEHPTFNTLIGMELAEWDRGFARIELQIRPEHRNGAGNVHGGVLMSLLDTVSGFSGVHPAPDEERRGCVTVSMTVKFLKPAASGRLTAEGRKQDGGRNLFFTQAEIRDETGALLATGDGIFRYRSLAGDTASE